QEHCIMGQQQLLLLVLAAVIVGVAIVMGINMFGENASQANTDAVSQDVLTIAARAQSWFRRPTAMGGGGRTFIGMQPVNLNFVTPNPNGSYTITGQSLTEATITGIGNEDPNNDGTNLKVVVKIFADSIGTATITP
ncbi:MAG: hypothetical protein ACRENG_23900, partial [bacterium]